MASIFLSHSSHDNDVAMELSRRLKTYGYDSLFLDFDPDSGLKAGSPWERELYRNLKLAGAVVVVCSPDSMASRWCFVEIAQARALGKAVFPIVVRPCQVDNLLMDRQVIDMITIGVDEACRRLFDGLHAAGLDPRDSFHWDPKRPPYPGLNCFDAEDAGIYFGREDEVRRVIEALTRLQRQGGPRLFVLVGASGSGKSSLVRAGVLPRLGKDRSRWVPLAPFRPGAEAIRTLARSLSSAFPEGAGQPDWKAIRDRLRAESRAAAPGDGRPTAADSVLADYADELTMQLGRPDASVLMVVDQVEELLQDAESEEVAPLFHVLRRAVEQPGGRVFGLLTLRSDFLGTFQNHPTVRGLAFADLPLGPLPLEKFPLVIEGPADRAAIALEPGLVNSMAADAQTDDALPLLAFTLREMYERCRDQQRLTLQVYHDDLGGIQGAVAHVIERIKTESTWTPEDGRALRRAFLKLIRLNDDGQFTRQPCRWADLPDRAAPILEAFVKARLLSSDGDMVEVSHESLFRVWPELAGWLDESRELMLWKKNIHDEMKDWISHERSPLYLLSGARVSEGRRWLAASPEELAGPASAFITASIAAEDDRIARERRQQKTLRVLASSLAVAALAASLIGVYAYMKSEAASRAEAKEKRQRVRAEEAAAEAKAQTSLADSRRIAALADAERDKSLDRSLILAVEARKCANTLQARNSLFSALHTRPEITSFLPVGEGDVASVSLSPDGRFVAAGYAARGRGGIMLWDLAHHERLLPTPLAAPEGEVGSVAFSPDGKTLAAGYGRLASGRDTGGVVLWDVAQRARLADERLSVAEGTVWSVAFSPDGKMLAAGFYRAGDGGGVVLWDVARRERVVAKPLAIAEGNVQCVAFSPDGKTLLAGGSAGVMSWDVRRRERASYIPRAAARGTVWSFGFSRDGKRFAAGSSGGLLLRDPEQPKELATETLAFPEGYVRSVAFSPDGNTLATGYSGEGGGGIALWDVAGRERLNEKPLVIGEGNVRSVAFSADGKTLAAGYYGRDCGGAVLCDMTRRERLIEASLAVDEGIGGVTSVAFSPDGETLAAGYFGPLGVDSGVVLWDAPHRERLAGVPLSVAEGGVVDVEFSRDGKLLAAGYRLVGKGGVVLWDMVRRERAAEAPLPVVEGEVKAVAFRPDGRILAAAYDAGHGGGVILWDVGRRERTDGGPPPIADGQVTCLSFSPDGETLAVGHGRVGDDRDSGGVVLWNLARREPIVNLPVAEGGVWCVAFTRDAQTLAAGYTSNGSGGVVLWDAARRARRGDAPLSVAEGGVWDVAFSPDGKYLTAGFLGRLNTSGLVLWETARRERLVDAPLTAADGALWSACFSPDGKTLAAGYRHRRVILWDVDVNSWIAKAGAVANRNLSREEWRRYFGAKPYTPTFANSPIPPADGPSRPSPTKPAGLSAANMPR